jgi:hypothetical protein
MGQVTWQGEEISLATSLAATAFEVEEGGKGGARSVCQPAGLSSMRRRRTPPAGAPAALGGSSWSLWDSGEWWMLLAAQSMAVGTVMVRWVAKYADPVVATGWHMVLGGLPLLALSVVQEGGQYSETLGQLTGEAAAPAPLPPTAAALQLPCRLSGWIRER